MPACPYSHAPQGDLGLNICEAHAFNTKDRFSLDVFVVNGWAGGGTEELEEVLSRRLQELPPPVVRGASGSPPSSACEQELRVPQEELDVLARVGRAGGGEAAGHKREGTAVLVCRELAAQAPVLLIWAAWCVCWHVQPHRHCRCCRRGPWCPAHPALQQATSSAADNDWELDPNEIIFHEKIASGAPRCCHCCSCCVHILHAAAVDLAACPLLSCSGRVQVADAC